MSFMRAVRSEMAVFASVVEKRCLAAAAREFGLTPSAVSRIVARLEERLSVRLIQRNTRHLVPTEAGMTYYAWCRHILHDLSEAEAALDQARTTPAGWLRLRAPEVFGRERICTLLPGLMARYPEMQVELVLTDALPDPNQDGSDLGFRIGALANSQLIVRRLCTIRSVLVASPAYLSGRRPPAEPSGLADHRLVAFPCRSGAPVWLLHDRSGRAVPVVEPLRLACNAVDGIARLAIDGAGIALLPTYLAGPEIEAGRLVRVLPGWEGPPEALSAVYASTQFVPPKVRAALDFFIERLRDPAAWDAAVDAASEPAARPRSGGRARTPRPSASA
jgi:DNA-binding transcriptional LysR family regulator